MCFVWISEQRVTFSLYNFSRLVFITEVESVYCAVHTESLRNQKRLFRKGLTYRFLKPKRRVFIARYEMGL